MKLTKSLIPIFLLFITVKAIAQCPSGAQPYIYDILTISSGQTYCVSGEINNLWGLTIASGGKLIVLPDSKLILGNNLTLNGTLEVYGGVELNSGMQMTTTSILEMKNNSYFSMTGQVQDAMGKIKMADYSVVEFCNNFYRQISGNPMILYTGTGKKAYFISKNQASAYWDMIPPSLIGDNSNIVWIAMGSVLGVAPGNASYCGPNATPSTCSSLWPEGLTSRSVCFEAEEIISKFPNCTEFSGAVNSDWTNSANWNNGIPDAAKCAIIPNGKQVEITTTADAQSLTIESGGKLIINGNGILTVQDYVNNASETADFIIEDGGQLVQVNNDALNSGNYTVHRNFHFSAERNQYNFVISPAIGQITQTIYPGNPTVIELDEETDWYYNAPEGGIYIDGKGYSIREASTSAIPANSVRAVFKGGIPNGNIVYQLEKNSYGMNLVGNPYPSKIKSTDFYNQNSSYITPNIYFWDNRNNTQIAQQGSNYSGTNYAILNAFTGIGIAAPGTAGMPQRVPTTYINPGTAFIVEALNSGPLYFTNTQRIGNGSAPDFFGRAGEIEEEETEKDVYWLILKSPEGMETMTAVAYFEGGNNDFSVDDSEAFETSDEIYSLLGDKQLVIQGKAAFKVNDRILLGMRLFNPGKHIIQLYDTQGIFSENQPIYLRDKKTKTIHNLSEKSYKFANEAGEINNRFEIIYRKPILDPIATVFARVEITQANKEIIVQSTQEQIIQVELFDLNGKSLYKVDSNALEVRIPTQNTKKQILIVTVKTASGEIISKKLIH